MSGYDLAAVNKALRGTMFEGRTQHFPVIDSTNAEAQRAAAAGAAAGSVFVADEQTAGRGRGGHSWHSASGDGLYVSVLLRPQMAMTSALKISLAVGLAAQEAMAAACGVEADIRWPNDLMLGGKKCGGILVETAAESERLRHVVIGVGINVNHAGFDEELSATATSLRMETGAEMDREALLIALLRALEREMKELSAGGDVLRRFTAKSTWARGKRVTVEDAGGYTGTTNGLDESGFLRVSMRDGTERLVLSGGVREVK